MKLPLRWEGYRELRERFNHAIQFESEVGGVLVREMEQPVGARRVLKDSQKPLIARRVGTTKSGRPGVRYPDFLVVDETTLAEGRVPRVDSFSVKKRDFSNKSKREVERQVETDTQEAMGQYGGSLEVRRPGHPLYGRTVQVSKVHLVYQAEGVGHWMKHIQDYCARVGVEVHFE
ncbi:MAG: hypothetical protein JXB05_31825 [Myxococcaceae bacterium]|nr:hypothetical protein [Myxococcaceae bacterium]